jgi:hypothetical protein
MKFRYEEGVRLNSPSWVSSIAVFPMALIWMSPLLEEGAAVLQVVAQVINFEDNERGKRPALTSPAKNNCLALVNTAASTTIAQGPSSSTLNYTYLYEAQGSENLQFNVQFLCFL